MLNSLLISKYNRDGSNFALINQPSVQNNFKPNISECVKSLIHNYIYTLYLYM